MASSTAHKHSSQKVQPLPWDASGLPWNFFGNSMRCPWHFHGNSPMFPRHFCGSSRECLQYLHGFGGTPTAIRRDFCGFYAAFFGRPCDFYGTSTGFVLPSHFHGNEVRLPWDFLGASVGLYWAPVGFHRTSEGFAGVSWNSIVLLCDFHGIFDARYGRDSSIIS